MYLKTSALLDVKGMKVLNKFEFIRLNDILIFDRINEIYYLFIRIMSEHDNIFQRQLERSSVRQCVCHMTKERKKNDAGNYVRSHLINKHLHGKFL